MRYEKPENLIRLAIKMQGTAEGVGLKDIQDEFSVGRRTAERMRDAIRYLFPQIDEITSGDRIKRWRLPSGTINNLVNFTADELAHLEVATSLLKRENLLDAANSLENITSKITGLMQRSSLIKVDPDLEALVQAEGFAIRPGPRPIINQDTFESLRTAIKQSNTVEFHYRSRSTGALSRQDVCPYGFLYGPRHYLVAYSLNPQHKGFRLFVLANIEKVDVLDAPFQRQSDFSLTTFAERSFGVYQEDPFDVVWHFSKRAAVDAKDYFFHPTQKLEPQDDGSLILRFKAGGILEMAWHLANWDDEVEVIQPEDFWDQYEEQSEAFWEQNENED